MAASSGPVMKFHHPSGSRARMSTVCGCNGATLSCASEPAAWAGLDGSLA